MNKKEYNLINSIEKQIFEQTTYSGTKIKKTISCSQLGNEPYQIHLSLTEPPQEEEFGQNTLGSIFDIGLKNILANSGKRMLYKMPNNWFLSGEPDYIDWEKEIIIDYKLTKLYTGMMVKKEGLKHQYARQLNGYRYLAEANSKEKHNFKIFLLMFYKDGGFNVRKEIFEPIMELIEIPVMEKYDFEEMFFELCNEVEKQETFPTQCNELWMRKGRAGSYPMKCKIYCSYNKICKFYNPNQNKIIEQW